MSAPSSVRSQPLRKASTSVGSDSVHRAEEPNGAEEGARRTRALGGNIRDERDVGEARGEVERVAVSAAVDAGADQTLKGEDVGGLWDVLAHKEGVAPVGEERGGGGTVGARGGLDSGESGERKAREGARRQRRE